MGTERGQRGARGAMLPARAEGSQHDAQSGSLLPSVMMLMKQMVLTLLGPKLSQDTLTKIT